MFSLNFYPEAPVISNKLDSERFFLCLRWHCTNHQFAYVPVSLYYLCCIYTTRVGPLLPPLSMLPLLWHFVAKAQKLSNKQNNTQAREKMTLITTQAACSWLAGLTWFCFGWKLGLYLWKLLGGGRSYLAQPRKHGLKTQLGVGSATSTAKDTSPNGFPGHWALEASRPTAWTLYAPDDKQARWHRMRRRSCLPRTLSFQSCTWRTDVPAFLRTQSWRFHHILLVRTSACYLNSGPHFLPLQNGDSKSPCLIVPCKN